METPELHREPLDGPAAVTLIVQLQDEYVVRYGGPDANPLDPGQFAPPGGEFLVAYLDGAPVACGGFREIDADNAELKRMFVVSVRRRLGLARRVLAALEEEARRRGYRALCLETGTQQPEAIELYRSCGYEPVANFGYYRDSVDVRSFRKTLSPK